MATLRWGIGLWGVDTWGAQTVPVFVVPIPTPVTYSVDLCAGFVKVGEATAFQLDAVLRLLAVGEWLLSAPLAGLECPDVGAVDSIIVYDNAVIPRIVFAGLVRKVGGVEGGVARVVAAEGTTLEFRGVDIYGLLAQRKVWPSPSTDPPWADAHDVRSGVGSSVAAGYITANIGSGAILARQVAGVTVVDPVVGATSTWSGRLQPLDQMVGRICRESGIVCVATMTAPGSYRFLFQSPHDLSDTIIFTDQGDLEELSRLVAPATATYIVAAGQGELTARSFATADSGAVGLDRVETIYENTNITTSPGLTTAANTELILQGEDVAVDGLVAADAAQRIRFLDDYQLGDWLGIEVDSVRYASQVEAVTISLTAQREVVRPVMGRASSNDALTLLRDVAGIASRLDRQTA